MGFDISRNMVTVVETAVGRNLLAHLVERFPYKKDVVGSIPTKIMYGSSLFVC